MKMPAAKFDSSPDQAMPMATPAAARIPAKDVVSTPKTPRTAISRMMLRSTDRAEPI